MRSLLGQVPQLQRLGVFEAVGRCGSFTGAANDLGISQPAVSRHVRLLEGQLGITLFDRGPNRIGLTAEGMLLHRAVVEGFLLIETALEGLHDSSLRLVIASQASPAQAWLAPKLEVLQQRLAPCSLSVVVFDRDTELDSIDYDVVLRAGSGHWPGFRCEKLIPEVVVPVAAPELAARLGLGPESSPELLLDAPLLMTDRRGRAWMSWSQWFGFHGLEFDEARAPITYDSHSTTIQEAIKGAGVTLNWRGLRGNFLDRGTLVEVAPEVQNPEVGHYVVWPVALARDGRVRVVRDFLREVIGSDRLA